MKPNDTDRLIHAVLDGEATPAEAAEVERRAASDPALAKRLDEWRRVFGALGRMPVAYAPEGLVASVMAKIPQDPAPAGQLPAQAGVIGAGSEAVRESIPAPVVRRSGRRHPWRDSP